MSNYSPIDRVFHPAVPMLHADWPVIPVEPQRDAGASYGAVGVELAAGTVRQLVVVGFKTGDVASWAEPTIQTRPRLSPTAITELAELRWLLRDLGSAEPPDKWRIHAKSAATFVVPEQALNILRHGMLSVVSGNVDCEDPAAVVAGISDEDIGRYVFEKIDNMFFSIVDMYIAQGETTPLIATEGGFDRTVISALLDRFEVNFLDSIPFANNIYRAVWNYVRSGGSFGGDWGYVARIGSNLYMLINQSQEETYVDDGSVDLMFE